MTAPVAKRGFTEEAVSELIERRAEPAWMREHRLNAWKTFQQIPMPTRQDEEWRRTDLRTLKLGDVAVQPSGATPGPLLPERESSETFAGFVGVRDGALAELRLDPVLAAQGVIFTDLVTALREHEALVREYFMTRCVPPADSKFTALHAAFWDNGVFLYVPRGVVIEAPLRSVVAAGLNGTSSLAHTLIVMEQGSQATFVEDVASDTAPAQGYSSRVTELFLKPGASLYYTSVQRWGRNVYDFHTERALLERDSQFHMLAIELGSRLSKGRVETVLTGDGVSSKMQGLYVADGDQHLDRYTLQDHRAANGVSDLLYKGVLTDTARSVFSGLIRVAPGAIKTAAYQQNRNLLLSRSARADSIPNLEIAASDIIGCSHGATVGKVDAEQVYYLMCRGLTHEEATQLIVEGFVEPLIEQVPVAGLKETLREEVERRMKTPEGD